jgi:hypothetical protein
MAAAGSPQAEPTSADTTITMNQNENMRHLYHGEAR